MGLDRDMEMASSLAQTQEIIEWLMVRETLINAGQVGKTRPERQSCDGMAWLPPKAFDISALGAVNR